MNNKRVKLASLLFLWCGASAFAQNNSVVIARNIKTLENYTEANPLEKVHLHLDRQLYFPGDTIWFKAYVVAGTRHKPSGLSGLLYVELVNPKDSIEKRLTVKLNAGICNAEFPLAFDVATGNYRVRAYTNWMRNAGPEYFYDQLISVSGFSAVPEAVSNQGAGSTAGKIDLQFFPEGGDLVNDVKSRVAFKAVDQNGFGVDVHGTIVNDVGTEQLTFASRHLGMGSFLLRPQKGETYFAKVATADGKTLTVPLPMAKDASFALAVGSSADSLYVKIVDRNMPDTAFYLLAQGDGHYYISAGDKLTSKVFRINMPKDIFPTGIVQFTLFSQNGEPVNERLVFVQSPDMVDISLNPGKPGYAPGSPVNFALEARDATGVSDIGNFSVSVIDETRAPVNEDNESTILTDLLLKSELGGNIEAPNYYFANPSDQTRADLDLLMLTQGYHRFEWKKILAGSYPEAKYQPENGFLALSGTVKTPAGAPVQHGHVILTAAHRNFVLDTLTNTNGKFIFENLDLPDTTRVVVKARNANGGNNVILTFDQPDYPPVTKYKQAGTTAAVTNTVTEVELAYASWKQDSLKNVISLKEVKIKGSKTPPFHPDYAVTLKHSMNLNGPGQADQVIMGDKLASCTNVADCLRYLIRGGVKWTVDTVYSEHKSIELVGPGRPMAVDFNGVIMDQKTAMSVMNPLDISSIEILVSDQYLAIYGEQGAAGLIIITTKEGDNDDPPPPTPGMATYAFKPWYKSRQFYSPKYPVNTAALAADTRKTVYWSPDLATDATGKTSFEYFNAGTKGNYRVVVEGIDTNGRLGRKVFTYKVE